jgi:hypothetical protein
MFDKLFKHASTRARHVTAPFAEERALLDEYLQATGLGAEPGSLLFPAALRNTGKLSADEEST